MEKTNSTGDKQCSFAFNSIMRLVLFQQGERKQTKGGVILRLIAHEQRQECFCTLRDVQKLPTLLQYQKAFSVVELEQKHREG